MKNYIEVKSVPSVIVLTHLESCSADGLEKMAYQLYGEAEMSEKDSIFCLIDKPYLEGDVEVKVCCPISSVDIDYDKDDRKIEVLPHSLVLTVVHLGEYNDLRGVFKDINEYIEKNNLTVSLPYRVIFHREKREKHRSIPFEKPERDYVTEIQISLES